VYPSGGGGGGGGLTRIRAIKSHRRKMNNDIIATW